jgi:hypothetical protein
VYVTGGLQPKGGKALVKEAILLFEGTVGVGFRYHLDTGSASGRNSGGTTRRGDRNMCAHTQRTRVGGTGIAKTDALDRIEESKL